MVNQPKKRCVPCVEQKLRRLVRDKTLENRRLEARELGYIQSLREMEADNAKLREALEKITITYGSAGAIAIARTALIKEKNNGN